MSVNFKVAGYVKKETGEFPAFKFNEVYGKNKTAPIKEKTILMSSEKSYAELPKSCANRNSFVYSAYMAYSGHRHLVIRPDDIWMAIVTQFSAYVNANSEVLRDRFVDFNGQKELVVIGGGTLFTAQYDDLTMRMTDQIAANIKSPEIKDWVIPNFTTTTYTDRIVGAVSLMASMKSYFTYKMLLRCGLPEVTLKGTVEDWVSLKERINKLVAFDLDGKMKEWVAMLDPIADHFIQSAKGNPDLDWWNQIANHIGGGSGPTYLSGWITAFCVFNDEGKWVSLKSSSLFHTPVTTPWVFIETHSIPAGFLSVPVTIDDNGTIYKSEMFAGHMAIDTPSSDSISPRLDWCLFLLD